MVASLTYLFPHFNVLKMFRINIIYSYKLLYTQDASFCGEINIIYLKKKKEKERMKINTSLDLAVQVHSYSISEKTLIYLLG